MAEAPHHHSLRVLQFNVWLDATKVRDGLRLVADAILDSKADIVSLCEVKNLRGDFVERLKKELRERGAIFHGRFAGNPLKFGMDADTAIISRYPILEEKIVYRTRENCIVRSMVDLGDSRGTVGVYSVHLEYRSYSCYLPRGYCSHSDYFRGWSKIGRRHKHNMNRWNSLLNTDCFWNICGMGTSNEQPQPVTDTELIRRDNLASGRPEAILRLIHDAQSLEEKKVPIIVMGDFNEPSTLDWTEGMADMADHHGLEYRWDTTERLREHGYVDSYRAVHPDPATHPGFTWPAVARGEGERPRKTDWIKGSDERDRIDFIFSKGGIKSKDSWLVGTPLTSVKDELVDESNVFHDRYSYSVRHPWPSDHRAVITVFDLD